MNNIPVVFLPAGVDACALYRHYLPHLNIEKSMFLLRRGAIDIREVQHCKVAIVQRQVSEHNRAAILRLKEAGLKIIYDLDDNIWNLPSANPGKRQFDQMREGFEMCAREAHMLTVSTRGLATAAKTGFKLDKEIFIVPNAMDFRLFKRKNLHRDDGNVVIGWGGSNTHSADLKDALDVLPEVMDENPHVLAEFVGAPPTDGKDINGNPIAHRIMQHKQTRFRFWVPVAEYANRFASWGWDIAMAPLTDHRFNKSKSNIKMLEAAAMRIPCLVSDVQPYEEFCALGGDTLKWLLCSTHKHWKDKLKVLINEPELRDEIGNKMYEVASAFYNMEKVAGIWSWAFQKVLSC